MKLERLRSCDRVEYILRKSEGKRVLHLGCADWPFTGGKIDSGTLLHMKLKGVARELVGVDIEEEGIALMRKAGMDDLVAGDGERPLSDLLGVPFEVIIAGEIIEHVPNKGLFLDSIRSVCTGETDVVLTTQNFAPLKRAPRLLWGNEVVHPDHVCYFSVSTLSSLLRKCSFRPIEWRTYWEDVGLLSRNVNRLLRPIPLLQGFSDGLCVTCRPDTDAISGKGGG